MSQIDKSNETTTLPKLFNMADYRQMKHLGLKTEKEYQETMTAASKIPFIKLVEAKFVVPGEDLVTPSSKAHLQLKLLVKSSKDKYIWNN